jgi:hypothetical protein
MRHDAETHDFLQKRLADECVTSILIVKMIKPLDVAVRSLGVKVLNVA